MKFNVSICQKAPFYFNPEKCLEQAEEAANYAKTHGSSVLVLPESWFSGYPIWFDFADSAAKWDNPVARNLFQLMQKNSLNYTQKYTFELRKISKENGVVLIFGANSTRGFSLYNSLLIITPEGQVFERDKIMPTYTEKLVHTRAKKGIFDSVESNKMKIGGLICWEHWMPMARQLMHDSGEMIHAALWPTCHEMHRVASRHYAFEGRNFVLASGTILKKEDLLQAIQSNPEAMDETVQMIENIEEEWLMSGGSCIVDPFGNIIAETDKESYLTAEIDTDLIIEAKMTLDVSGNFSRPDLFHYRLNNPSG